MNKSRYLQGKRIAPTPITKETSIVQLIENNFQAYNAARLREGAQLFAERMLQDDVTVCLTLTGALTPAGLGI
jgi:deoxyhypusine synthase